MACLPRFSCPGWTSTPFRLIPVAGRDGGVKLLAARWAEVRGGYARGGHSRLVIRWASDPLIHTTTTTTTTVPPADTTGEE